jgi:hypothetical protein
MWLVRPNCNAFEDFSRSERGARVIDVKHLLKAHHQHMAIHLHNEDIHTTSQL